MPEDPSRFYASAPIQALLAHELASLAPVLSGVYGNHGLFVRAHAAAPVGLPPHLLGGIIQLAPTSAGWLEGSLRCDPADLPFASESFKVLIVQHAFERIDCAQQCAVELVRVLAPEGVALVLGFNPLGSWRPWLVTRRLRGCPHLHLQSASAWQELFAREGVDTLQVRYPGCLWPHAGATRAIDQSRSRLASMLARFGSSWLLLARKRRSTLTPLRLRSNQRELALNPHLVPGARRECA